MHVLGALLADEEDLPLPDLPHLLLGEQLAEAAPAHDVLGLLAPGPTAHEVGLLRPGLHVRDEDPEAVIR